MHLNFKKPEYKELRWKNFIFPKYMVSSDGRIYFASTGEELSRRIINNRNYVTINCFNKKCLYRIDYIVAYTFLGNYDDIIRLIHNDDNVTNDHLENLMWYRKCDVATKYAQDAIIESNGHIEEEWRECELDYPCKHKYYVNNFGAVRDDEGKEVNIKTVHGYSVFFYIEDSPSKQTRIQAVHRAVAKAFIPNPKNYPMVNHIDGNKFNNIVINLEWVDNSMYSEHAYQQNLHKHGKYTEQQIRSACMLLMQGDVPQTQISYLTGINRKTVSDIKRGHRWKSVSQNFIIPVRKWNTTMKNEIRQSIIDGMKGREIAEKFNITYDQLFISLYERMRRNLRKEGKLK